MFEREPICMKQGSNSNTKNVDMGWRVPPVVILVEALNMHGNSEGFTGLYPLSSIEAAAPLGEKVRQRAKPSGKQDRVTICGILDHHPLHTKQHL